ncbi:hypothetical protein BDB00DRAFT_364854 [Zychaea mexicana]|uniref:uncharacterized protein n=1 Tax=Zychaea mexicana TaxID=64656 RepID=UPI0022FE3517|nr:uncharacterized protein BDB00DRAFT_364854 [Zychaea mexicana]KAI9493529.1 hypothetical protein BDB00DRAFT_364854 [Zychaea mexicana]
MSDSLLLLDAILREISASKELTSENTQLLFALFQDTLYEALYLIDQNAVKRVHCKAGRVLYRVTDTILEQHMSTATTTTRTTASSSSAATAVTRQPPRATEPYTCLVQPRFCSCPEFFDSTICEQQALVCRHALAAVLGDALDMLPNQDPIGDEELAETMYRWQVEE